MKVSDAPAVVKKLRKTPWRFQRTFKTPLKNLQSFLATIVSTGATQTARITIEQAYLLFEQTLDDIREVQVLSFTQQAEALLLEPRRSTPGDSNGLHRG